MNYVKTNLTRFEPKFNAIFSWFSPGYDGSVGSPRLSFPRGCFGSFEAGGGSSGLQADAPVASSRQDVISNIFFKVILF